MCLPLLLFLLLLLLLPQDHISACKELQSSATFKQLLAATLAVGNFLNHGSRLGNAPGFRLKGLNKLHDSRSTDGKSTMLQVIVCFQSCKDVELLQGGRCYCGVVVQQVLAHCTIASLFFGAC